jgi:hypothetical protein
MVETDSSEALVDGRDQVSSLTITVARIGSDEPKAAAAEFTESVERSQSDG